MAKVYLGDGVYADRDGDNVVLTTENGIDVTNRIVLEPEVISAIVRFLAPAPISTSRLPRSH